MRGPVIEQQSVPAVDANQVATGAELTVNNLEVVYSGSEDASLISWSSSHRGSGCRSRASATRSTGAG